ncbi:hypothetical protein [Nakamurella sp.]
MRLRAGSLAGDSPACPVVPDPAARAGAAAAGMADAPLPQQASRT